MNRIISFLTIFGALILVGLSAQTFSWIKRYGDFATTTYVQEAKAECIKDTDTKISEHESREEIRLTRIENKIDQLLIKN